MDAFADKLGRVGAWCGQNKYLGAIKNAFQNFMPATIAGAIGVLWTNVLVNDNVVEGNAQGLGGIFEPIMALKPINDVFAAISFCTISCISIGIVMLVAQEIGEANGETGAFPAVLGFMSWAVVTPTTTNIWQGTDALASGAVLPAGTEAITTVGGFEGSYLGATGLFTALLVGIIALEIYNLFRKMDALKIKMPEQVPPGVARAFEVLIPAVITLAIIALIGRGCELVTGLYLNDVISTYIQGPLGAIGSTIPGVIIIYIIIGLFWLVGIHGNNMLSAVKEALFTPLMLENIETFSKTNNAKGDDLHIFAMAWLQMFGEFGGSGVTIGLVIAIMIFSKREDNRTIAGISLVPGLFNINETVTFGIPMVLNPILGIPFVLAPIVTLMLGYVLTVIGFCPKAVINTPWTTPPILHGFLTTGANIMGAVSQAIAIVASILIYAPFLIAYERYQNKQAAEAAE